MAATTIEQILNAETLIGMIQAVKDGINTKLPPQFFTPTRSTVGNTGYYYKVDGNRQTARLVNQNAPSVRRDLKGVSKVPITLAHTKEHIILDTTILDNLKSMTDDTLQNMGKDEIARQVRNFAILFNNLRTSFVHSMLSLGKVHFDADGNLLPSDSGAALSIDYGIPAGNKSTCNILGTGAIVGAAWSTAGTDIQSHVEKVILQIAQLCGYDITTAYYGKNIFGYLCKNTAIKDLLKVDTASALAFNRGQIPDGFLGIQKWIPMATAMYADKDGTVREWFDGDQVTFTPDITSDVYDLIQGTDKVPTALGNVASDANAMLANIKQVLGMYSYATLTDEASIKQVFGDTFLPVWNVPKAMVLMDTTP